MNPIPDHEWHFCAYGRRPSPVARAPSDPRLEAMSRRASALLIDLAGDHRQQTLDRLRADREPLLVAVRLVLANVPSDADLAHALRILVTVAQVADPWSSRLLAALQQTMTLIERRRGEWADVNPWSSIDLDLARGACQRLRPPNEPSRLPLAAKGPSLPLPRPELLVDTVDGYIAGPSGRRISLDRRRPMHGLLYLFAARAAVGNRFPIAAHELIAAGWPGERMLPRAAINRLYVTLSRLRAIVLGDNLVAGRGGWRLADDLSVRVVELSRASAPTG